MPERPDGRAPSDEEPEASNHARGRVEQDLIDGEELTISSDEAKGRIKEAAGDLTDDKDLKREGKIDQAVGNVKEKTDDAGDKIKDAVRDDD